VDQVGRAEAFRELIINGPQCSVYVLWPFNWQQYHASDEAVREIGVEGPADTLGGAGMRLRKINAEGANNRAVYYPAAASQDGQEQIS
jgi:hypothetical protein